MSVPPRELIDQLQRCINGIDGFAREAAAAVGALNRDNWLTYQSLQHVAAIQDHARQLALDLSSNTHTAPLTRRVLDVSDR